jgi:hypothetical protein
MVADFAVAFVVGEALLFVFGVGVRRQLSEGDFWARDSFFMRCPLVFNWGQIVPRLMLTQLTSVYYAYNYTQSNP